MENSTGMDPLADEVHIENVLGTLGVIGRISLWVGFFGMALPTVVFYKMFLSEEAGKQRLFHVLTLTVTAMAAMAYLFMALGEGWIEVAGRPLFYMRYIDWIITTPILLLDLCLLAQAEIEKTALLFLMDILMVIGGFLGSLLTSWYKYLFWGVAMLMYCAHCDGAPVFDPRLCHKSWRGSAQCILFLIIPDGRDVVNLPGDLDAC